MALLRLGTLLTQHYATPELPVHLLWMGLVSQAGVTLGLTLIVAREFPDWGAAVQTLMLSLIVIHELAGPVLFRSALARAGEIGRGTTPERRADAAPARLS
jgi:hypothetical protein